METRNVLNPIALLSAAVSAALLAAAPAIAEETGRSFEIYGFAQADFIQDFDGRLRSGLGRRLPPVQDRHRRAVRQRRPVEHQRQAEPLRRERHDADGRGRHAAQLQVRVRPVRHGRRCRPDHLPPAPRLRRVGPDPRRPDQQPVHGRRRVPEHDRLLGPGGHGVLPQRADPLDAVQDGQQPLRDRHRASGQRHRLGQPAPDRGLRGPAGAERRGPCPT